MREVVNAHAIADHKALFASADKVHESHADGRGALGTELSCGRCHENNPAEMPWSHSVERLKSERQKLTFNTGVKNGAQRHGAKSDRLPATNLMAALRLILAAEAAYN